MHVFFFLPQHLIWAKSVLGPGDGGQGGRITPSRVSWRVSEAREMDSDNLMNDDIIH